MKVLLNIIGKYDYYIAPLSEELFNHISKEKSERAQFLINSNFVQIKDIIAIGPASALSTELLETYLVKPLKPKNRFDEPIRWTYHQLEDPKRRFGVNPRIRGDYGSFFIDGSVYHDVLAQYGYIHKTLLDNPKLIILYRTLCNI